MPTPCPACCPQPPEPPCPEPEAITVKVWKYCVPYTSPEAHPGVTVTVTDVDGVLPAVQGTTDADGLVTVETGGPGTFDVTIDTGECVEVIEDVVVRQCERLRLPDQAPCCGQLCIESYDYDTGLEVPGSPICRTILKPLEGPYGAYAGADGYFGPSGPFFFGGDDCVGPCNCADGYIKTLAVALYPWSNYTLAWGRWGACYPVQEDPCGIGRDPCDYETRFWWAVRRRLFATLGGAEPVVGGGGNVTLDLIHEYWAHGDPRELAWQGDATFAGHGYLVTSEYVNGIWTETARTRVDFDFLRVRVVCDQDYNGDRAYFQITNYWTPPGQADPVPVAPWSRDNGDGSTTALVPETYCEVNGVDRFTYPYAISNGRAMLCPGQSAAAAHTYYYGIAGPHHYCGGPHAMMDVAGTLWVGRWDGWQCNDYHARPEVTYRIWE